MYTLRLPSGDYLDLPTGQQFSFEMNNTLFSGSGSSLLPGAYSFPADLPATPRNRALLSHPDLVTNARNPSEIEGVWVFAEGTPLFFGMLRVLEANEKRIRVTVIANVVTNLKDLYLNELDLGGTRSLGADNAAALAHAKATATSPLSHDYCFFPVRNEAFLSERFSAENVWQNRYNQGTAAFTPDANAPGFMPFIRIEYLLSRIFAGSEFAFQNGFQIGADLRRLVLYNNFSLFTEGALNRSFDLRNHVPKVKVGELVRWLAQTFNLGFFTDPWNKRLKLLQVRNLVTAATQHDWSAYALRGHSVSHERDRAPERFVFRTPDDEAWTYFTNRAKPTSIAGTYATRSDLLTAFPISPGIYFITNEQAYVWWNAGFIFFYYADFGSAPTQTGDPVFECDLVPILNDSADIRTPLIAQEGTITYTYTPPGGSATTVKQNADCPARLMLYRGIQAAAGGSFPYASTLPYIPDGSAVIGDVSLHWEGAYNLYETFWASWHTMLAQGKHVTQSFILPVPVLAAFSLEQKVRVGSMDFFVKKLRVGKLVGGGKVLVEASLVSVV